MIDDPNDILQQTDRGVDAAEGVLARLFRQILFDVNVNIYKWDSLMVKYLNNPINGVPQNGKDRSSARGNLNKELRRPSMTWKVFRKGLRFLNPKGIRFEVHLEWDSKKKTVHSVTLSRNTDRSDIDDGESDEG